MALRIIGTGANEAIVSRGRGSIDAAEGGLMHIVGGDLLITHTEELAAIPRLFAVRCHQRQRSFPGQFSVSLLPCLLSHCRHTHPDNQKHPNPPCQSKEPARRHVCTSLCA